MCLSWIWYLFRTHRVYPNFYHLMQLWHLHFCEDHYCRSHKCPGTKWSTKKHLAFKPSVYMYRIRRAQYTIRIAVQYGATVIWIKYKVDCSIIPAIIKLIMRIINNNSNNNNNTSMSIVLTGWNMGTCEEGTHIGGQAPYTQVVLRHICRRPRSATFRHYW